MSKEHDLRRVLDGGIVAVVRSPDSDQLVEVTRATVPVVEWQGTAVLPNGEDRPGRRTPEVWKVDLR